MRHLTPSEFASIGSALLWPLAAGVAVAVRNKMRAGQARRLAALEERQTSAEPSAEGRSGTTTPAGS
ncbi:hypothetical protein LJR225_002741 [Phenylobacterium sp. LjRoot225]|uniref:hypothetical protein n=1 Tax=Phenylobacterium sp. LjRoot225 TaxID=3342285 RepID=UPI003ECC5A4D